MGKRQKKVPDYFPTDSCLPDSFIPSMWILRGAGSLAGGLQHLCKTGEPGSFCSCPENRDRCEMILKLLAKWCASLQIAFSSLP